MAATLIGPADYSFGLTAEAGVAVASFEGSSQRQKREVSNEVGDIVAVGYYAAKKVFSVSGTMKLPAVGLAAASPGVAIVLANAGDGGGIIVCDEFSVSRSNEDFAKFSGTFTQYPSIAPAP